MTRRRQPLRSPTLWVVVLVAVTGAGYAIIQARGPRVPVAIAARHDLEQHLVASGRVMAPARVEVSAQTTGLVTLVAVREGDAAKAGELLLQLDEREAQAEVAQAEAAVAQAKARADQVRSVNAVLAGRSFEEAEATYASSELQFERMRTLFSKGAATRQDLEDARRALDVARAQRDGAQASLAGASPRGVEARMAWAALSQAEAQRASAKARLTHTRIVALADSIVLERDVEPGMVVQPAKPLLVLASLGETRVVMQPDERDLPFINLGVRARASADAFPNDVFDAEIAYVAPSVEAQRGTIEVRLRVPQPPAYLRPDMTVSVDLTVATRKNTLVVPAEAVRGLATPQPWALVVRGNRAERQDLTLGIRGAGSVEIATGLSEGDAVVLPDSQSIRPGQRVRPARKD